MRVKLVLITDQGERTVYRLKKLPTIVGRGRDADLTLAHPLASRHHCELYEVEGTAIAVLGRSGVHCGAGFQPAPQPGWLHHKCAAIVASGYPLG